MVINKQHGFAHAELLLAIVALLAITFAGWRVIKKDGDSTEDLANSSQDIVGQSTVGAQGEADGPLLLKSVGFNLDYYDESANSAGDMVFTRQKLFDNQIWGDFGQQDPRSPGDKTKKNPQPTFILPLGTKALSLVDGVVINIEELYSGDYTIMMAKSKTSTYIYELEHVTNVLVKEGEEVKGGQVVADISTQDSQNHPGFGILEIGILHPDSNGGATHLCPFKYLDESIKEDFGSKITALHSSWEKYLGIKVYDQPFVSPGCVTEDPVSG